MTRFQKEISGALGAFWAENAKREAAEAVRRANADATVEPDGAIRWKSNGSYLMDDFCEKLEYAGYSFSRTATRKKREAQVERELAEYRANKHEMTAEQLAEARTAFGPGETIVNVLTGEKTKL